MTDYTDKDLAQSSDTELRSAIRELSPMAPDPEYRARVKAEFAGGSRPMVAGMIEPAERSNRAGGMWLGVGLAAAAALALLLLLRPSSPEWALNTEMIAGGAAGGGTVAGEILVDGLAVDSASDPMITTGSRVYNPGPRAVCLEVEGALTLLLASQSEVTLSSKGNLLGDPTLIAELHRGQIMAKTGTEFPGGGLTLSTEDAWVRVTGTIFGVIKGADSTCVCVFEGTVESRHRERPHEGESISHGSRYSLYGSTKQPLTQPLYPLSEVEQSMLNLLVGPEPKRSNPQ